MLDTLKQAIRAFIEGFFIGDRFWGYLRLGTSLVLLLAFILIGHLVGRLTSAEPVRFFSVSGLRYWVFPLAAFLGALFLAGHFVRDVYELPGLRPGLRYMIASAFSFLHPRLRVNDGQKILEPEEINLLEVVGGPGYINVSPNSAILEERLTGPSSVHGGGSHFITRWERLKETVNLADQHGLIEELKATTKDGIRVVMKDVHYRYRLRTGRQYGDYTKRTKEDPYPYSVRAVRDMVYGRIVLSSGLAEWDDAVRSVISSVITNYIQRNQIDRLTAPIQETLDPRELIEKELYDRGARSRLEGVGAELLWVDIGHFHIKDKVVGEQRVDTWGAKWEGDATVKLAYGEAQRLAYQELGRAEAQAEMIISIMEALKNIRLSDDPKENMHNLILIRTAQILEGMAERSGLEPPKGLPKSTSKED